MAQLRWLGMRYSNNVINNCLIAWAATEREIDQGSGLERVARHFQRCYRDQILVDEGGDGRVGLALLQRPDVRLRWPIWHSDAELIAATLSLPAGWSRVVSGNGFANAASELNRELLRNPSTVAELDPPFTSAILSKREGSMVVLNDILGVGRLYEMRCKWGVAWSNRLGALPVFAGEDSSADLSSWQLLAAAGWFLGAATSLDRSSKVAPGSRIAVTRISAERVEIHRQQDDLLAPLVRPRRSRFALGSGRLKSSADVAAREVARTAADLGGAWSVPVAVSLTGGRDSRVSAAAVLAAGIDATFNTGDQVPGEVAAVRGLIAAAPVPMNHTVHSPDGDSDEGDLPSLPSRVADIHLVHDGMRNPQEIRRSVEIPHGAPPPPTLSGHGGEIGHGFYYGEKNKLKRLERGGPPALLAQLERNVKRKHSAATDESYEAYRLECETTLASGREHGLRGPVLLDWFYLTQRLAYRSGLGARSARWSACVTPSFIRGAFDLHPRERLSAKLHRLVVARLVPEWERIPFFSDPDSDEPMPAINRTRLWEKTSDASDVEEILAGGTAWPELFKRSKVLAMWAEVKRGEGAPEYEHIFDRVVWREAFSSHLEALNRAAR